MNALKVLIIVVALAIFGCAGVPTKNRVCFENAVDQNRERVEKLQIMRAEPRVTERCERVEGTVFDGVSLNPNLAFFRCDVADAIDDSDYAYLLKGSLSMLRMRIGNCLNR